MQAADRTYGQGAWSSFLICLFDSRTHACYCAFLIKQGFEDFLRIPVYSMRHTIAETLVQRFHVENGTFHLSCRVYAVLPLD